MDSEPNPANRKSNVNVSLRYEAKEGIQEALQFHFLIIPYSRFIPGQTTVLMHDLRG